MPASVLQQALKFSCEPGEDSGADARVSWLKSVFGVDAVAEQFVGKSRWTGEACEGPLFRSRMCGSLLPASATNPFRHSVFLYAAQRHMHEGRPLLQGPLNAGPDSSSALHIGRSPAVALHTAYKLDFGSSLDGADGSGQQAPLSLSAQACTGVVVVGHADGRLLAHACHGLLGPCWAGDGTGGAAAQCVADAKGEGSAGAVIKRAISAAF